MTGLLDDFQNASSGDRMQALKGAPVDLSKDVVKAAVGAAPTDDKAQEVAHAAVDGLTAEQREKFITSLIPQNSRDRMWVYIAGFAAAAAVAIGLSLVAWGASETESVSAAVIVLATGISSALIGGLLGAYVQR